MAVCRSLVIDGSFYGYRNLLLRQTVQAAALAAANKLPTYFSSGNGSTAAIVSAAQTFDQNARMRQKLAIGRERHPIGGHVVGDAPLRIGMFRTEGVSVIHGKSPIFERTNLKIESVVR